MKVLLIIPRRDTRSILPAPDIGVAYLASAALRAGAEVEVLDAHLEDVGPEKFKDWLHDKNFDLIGIKCLSIDLYNVLEYCRVIKENSRDTITVLGGPHPTALPDSVLQSGHVDCVIRGEGELGIFKLIKKIMNGNRTILLPEPISLEVDLDALGWPAWQLFKIKQYPQLPGPSGRFLPIITTRGCPNECTFCGFSSTYGKKVRTRSPENVIEEIKWLIKDFDIQKVSIFDDNFLYHKAHAIKISELYKKENFRVGFDISQGVRIDRIDQELIVKLAEAGCDYMGIGVESGSQKTLDTIKKGTNIGQIKETIDLIKGNSRIKLTGFFIIGFPHETESDILETISFALKLKLDYAAFTIFTPFPGTALFGQMIKEGYFSADHINWENLLLDKTTFEHRNISSQRLKKMQQQAYLRFYLRLSKLPFFFRIIREGSLGSYLKRFKSIIKR
ncbi:B12-binding domain-containing radical SAM protein [Candidatus Margulisiibacteriota bacterium]